jgi:hypothetical protein
LIWVKCGYYRSRDKRAIMDSPMTVRLTFAYAQPRLLITLASTVVGVDLRATGLPAQKQTKRALMKIKVSTPIHL